MNPKGTVTADWILGARHALAQGAAERLSGRPDRLALVTELAGHIDHLAAGLAVGRPELFEQHVLWVGATAASRDQGGTVEQLRSSLDALRSEILAAVPADVRDAVGQHLDRGIAAATRPPVELTSQLPTEPPYADLALRFLLAILESRAQDAHELVLNALDSGLGAEELLRKIVQSTQRELGRMWQTGEIDVASEHFGSRIAERLATLLHARSPRAPRNGKRVLVAAVGGNQHDFATRLLADALDRAGYDAALLGADTPPVEVARGAHHARADVVALSASIGTQVRIVDLTIRALRTLPETSAIPVIVGGMPFATIEGLWRDVGADATAADLAAAIEIVDRLSTARG